MVKEIEQNRSDIKSKTRAMLELQPNLSDMDPYTVQLLLTEQKRVAKSSSAIPEEEYSDSD